MGAGFEWDESLYAGSARFYAIGRLPYPQASFEADLRDLLAAASPTGVFRERARDIELVIWRKPAPT